MAARKLGNLNNRVVYLGGCVTALFITDPLALDVRTTVDVDCIIDIISLVEYYKFQKALKKKGFHESEEVICRFHCGNLILDVMPTDAKILGFGNRWYKDAVKNAVPYQIAQDLTIKTITPTYFLATKIEAFRTRGKNDYLSSSDFEDIITVIEGRKEIVDEVILSDNKLKFYLQQEFQNMLQDDQFETALPGHLNDGFTTNARVNEVKNRMQKIIVCK
jgi:hypothetical protein